MFMQMVCNKAYEVNNTTVAIKVSIVGSTGASHQ